MKLFFLAIFLFFFCEISFAQHSTVSTDRADYSDNSLNKDFKIKYNESVSVDSREGSQGSQNSNWIGGTVSVSESRFEGGSSSVSESNNPTQAAFLLPENFGIQATIDKTKKKPRQIDSGSSKKSK